jgi:hypothetical protein
MDNSSDEEHVDETSSVMSDLELENLDPSDANLASCSYRGCQDYNEDMPDQHAAVDTTPEERPIVAPSKCWLCTFSPHPIAVNMHSFVVSNIACMDLQYIASQIKHEILDAYPHAMVNTYLYLSVLNMKNPHSVAMYHNY